MHTKQTRKVIISFMSIFWKRFLKIWVKLLGSAYICLTVLGCSPKQQFSPSSTPDINLIPFSTQTPIKTEYSSTIDGYQSNTTPNPTLTPTPYLYQVVEGDTFTSIAYRHGVNLSDLIASNPTIDPNYLSIGISITIPITGNKTANIIEPTPIPIRLEIPICYSQHDGGLACVCTVTNNQNINVENVTVQINLRSSGNVINYQDKAVTPINILPAGRSLPIFFYLPPPIPEPYLTDVYLSSVLPSENDHSRYIKLNLKLTSTEISETELQATIMGTYTTDSENTSASQIWIIGVAYDSEGNPIGIRKWRTESPLSVGEEHTFKLNVYSLGPQIQDVKIFYEALP